jgi:hypothetical protein
VAEFSGSGGDEHNGDDEKEELGDLEGRFGSGGGESVEGGNMLERLGDQDEAVEVESN